MIFFFLRFFFLTIKLIVCIYIYITKSQDTQKEERRVEMQTKINFFFIDELNPINRNIFYLYSLLIF